MREVTRIFNLKDPKQAREFLSKLCLRGKRVTYVETADGVKHDFVTCTDREAVVFAQQLYEMQDEATWRGTRDRRPVKIRQEEPR